MKKRIISLFLCAVMLLSVLPVLENSVSAAETLYTVSATIAVPVSGEKPSSHISVGDHYRSGEIRWLDASGTPLTVNDVFIGGQKYTLEVRLVPDEGFVFAAKDDMTAVINGETATIINDVDLNIRRITREFTCAKAISSIAITGFVKPRTGETPVNSAAVSTEGLVLKSVSWKEFTTGTVLRDTDLFEGGKTYVCTAVVEAQSGYGFPSVGVTGTVDSAEASVRTIVDAPAQRSVSYTYTADTNIYTVSINDLTTPIMGAAPDMEATAHSSDYTVTKVEWWDESASRLMTETDVFKKAQDYVCFIYIEPVEGRIFAPVASSKATVNGKTAQIHAEYGIRWLQYSFTALEAIDKIAITGITEPVAGSTPVVTVLTDNPDYIVDTISWWDETGNRDMEESDVFVAGQTYTCTVYVKAANNHTLAPYTAMSATINGNAATVMPFIRSDIRKIVYTFTAPALAITTQPVAQTAKVSDTVSFTVSASVPSVHYQWYKAKGTAAAETVGTDSATLTIPAVTLEMDGTSFWCVVSAGSATVTSVKALLTVSALNPFTDVKEGAWYYNDVLTAVKLGFVKGKTLTTFCPNDNITYAEIVKLAACMNQYYLTGRITLQDGTGDVKWYAPYMQFCLEKEIIQKDYTSMANTPISRAEYVKIFYHALPESAFADRNTIPLNTIPDMKTSSPGYDEYGVPIYTFYRAGIVRGVDDYGTFLPNTNIKRCEVASVLIHLIDESTRVDAPVKLGQAR